MSRSSPRRWRRWLGAGAAIVGVVALFSWSLGAVGEPAGEWVKARRGDLVLGVEMTGKLEAVETSTVGPPSLAEVWQFKIARMSAEGEEVLAGAPILTFDTTELGQRLEQQLAEADRAAKEIERLTTELAIRRQGEALARAEAEARLRRARMKVDVPTELQQAGELAQAGLELELAEQELANLDSRRAASERAAAAALAGLESQRARAEQQVTALRSAIEQMTVAAPRDGTVILVADWNDNKKKVGDTCWLGEPLIELPDLSRMRARGQVHEADAGRIAEGQRVTLRLDSHPDEEFVGRVSAISRTVQRESWRSALKFVRLTIELERTDTRRMRPGMRFRGEVELERAADVLILPQEAVEVTPEGPRVWRRGWRGASATAVTLGRRNASSVEVLQGLAESDEVLRHPQAAGSV